MLRIGSVVWIPDVCVDPGRSLLLLRVRPAEHLTLPTKSEEPPRHLSPVESYASESVPVCLVHPAFDPAPGECAFGTGYLPRGCGDRESSSS